MNPSMDPVQTTFRHSAHQQGDFSSFSCQIRLGQDERSGGGQAAVGEAVVEMIEGILEMKIKVKVDKKAIQQTRETYK